MMKNLLKLFIVILMVSMASESFAQSFRIKAGLNLATMSFKDDQGNVTTPSKKKIGFNLGATVEIPFANLLCFETGLLLSGKGIKLTQNNESVTISPLYLEIPFNIKKTFELSGCKIYGTFGPYVGFGVGGKTKYLTTSDHTTVSIAWGSASNDDLMMFDLGLSVGAGIELNAFQLGLNYGFGLINISPLSNGNMKNKVIGITIGYKFKGK